MNKISCYEGAKNPLPKKNVEILTVLKDIKEGKYQILINKIQKIQDKEERTKEKVNRLPMASFAGTFKTRANNALIKASGYAMLDFDGVADLPKLIEDVNKDCYTFSSFISPSGNGLKVLVKIPPVSDDKTYKEYYYKIVEHYNQYAELDDSTKDIARGTFLSFDEDLFLNTESETFTDKFIAPQRPIVELTNVPLTEQNEIAERLEKWFKKKYSTANNRNTNLHAFARQFNAFGVGKHICEEYLIRYEQPDFRQSEILKLIESAYRYTEEHNTQAFEDNEKVKLIKNSVFAGADTSAIRNKVEDLPEENLKAEIAKHSEKLIENEFWYYTENEAIKLSSSRFKNYLGNNNVSKYYPNEDSGFLFIKKDSNFIKEFDENRIKDFVLNDLQQRSEIGAFELCADNTRFFKSDFLSMLDTSQIDIQRDTKKSAYIYYQNTALEITKDSINQIPYEEIKGLVWENQVIKRDFVAAPESEGEFKTFLWKIAGEQVERYYSFKSVIGYLLHSYQNEGKPKVIIFNDEMISDVPNGGSGKGLIHKAISHIKRLSTINGKGFDPNKTFAYQTVSTDTQVLLFDDIDKNFKFENLFSVVTEGLIIEKKGKDAIKIPFSESPKISITTNYTVQGEGSSHNRRVFEVEMSNYFSDKHTPEDEFKHLLFTDWDANEWAKFDNFMIRCVQYYLEYGLVDYDRINLGEKKLKDATNPDFIEFMDSKDWREAKRWYKTELKDAFLSEYEDYKFKNWFNSRLFNKWIKKWSETRKVPITEGKSSGTRYIILQSVPF